jgi:cytochrome b pre-mRNA-processing protein 3
LANSRIIFILAKPASRAMQETVCLQPNAKPKEDQLMNAIMRLFGFGNKSDPKIVDALYEAIVAAARQPFFYSSFGVADTPLGRFEVLSAHMALILRVSRKAEQRVKDTVQVLNEEFFKDVDHSLRELGIGDAGVPKRMKKLISMFYGRVDAYVSAIDAGDHAALMEAIERNMAPGGKLKDTQGFALYLMNAAKRIENQIPEAFLKGKLSFDQRTKA